MLTLNLYAQTLHDAKRVFGDYDRDIANLRRSIDMFNRIIRKSRNQDVLYGAYWMKSRAYSTMGDHPALTGTDALKDYEAGKTAGAEAIKINRNGEKGYFWYAVNLGKVGRLKGVLHALFMLPEFERCMDRAYALQPNDPWVLVAYGALYYELPWIVGGSDSKALGYLKRALDVAPDFTVSMVLMGRVYIKEGAYDKARSVLGRVVQCKDPASRADWAMSDSPAAQELLHHIDTMQRAGRQGGVPSVQEAPSFFPYASGRTK